MFRASETPKRLIPPALVGADRPEDPLVQVATGRLGDRKLEQAIGPVRDQPRDEPAKRLPVEPGRVAAQVRDGGDQEEEMDDELREPLGELVPVESGVEVEEPDQVHEEEREEEGAEDSTGARHRPVPTPDPRDGERDHKEARGDIRDAHVDPTDRPADFREGDRENGREEQRVEEVLSTFHATLRSTSASSSARAALESRVRASAESVAPSSSPASPAALEVADRTSHAVDVVRRDDDRRARLVQEASRLAVGRNDRQNRTLRRQVLEDLGRENAAAAPLRVRNDQEQRLRVSLEREGLSMRQIRNELEPVGQPEPLGPFAVGRPEVPDEAGGDVHFGTGEGLQEGTRGAASGETTRVRDPETRGPPVGKPLEVVEVAAVRDHGDRAARGNCAHLVGDRARSSDDRIRPPRHLLRERTLPAYVTTTVWVRCNRITEVGDPWDAHPPSRQTDEMDRAGRRGGQDDVDSLPLDDAPGCRDRRHVPEHTRVRHEQCTERDRHLAPDARDAPQPVELLTRPSRRRADVPGPVNDDSLGLAQGVVPLHPFRPRGRKHVDLEAEPRKLAGKLERTLDAGPARRRPVHRDEQEPHCRPFWRRGPSPCIAAAVLRHRATGLM